MGAMRGAAVLALLLASGARGQEVQGPGKGAGAPPAAPPPSATAPAPTPAAAPAANGALSPAARKAAQAADRLRSGDLHGALFDYQEAANLDPRSADLRMELGRCYERLRYFDRAAEEYTLAAALAPPGTEALRRAERARAAARGAHPPVPPADGAAGPSTPAASSYEEGVALIGRGRYAEAIGRLDEAVRLDPKLGVAYAARASALFGLGRYGEAAGDYRTAMALDPHQATPLYGLAECHRLLGEKEKAADYYARYVDSTAPDVRDDLRADAVKRIAELKR